MKAHQHFDRQQIMQNLSDVSAARLVCRACSFEHRSLKISTRRSRSVFTATLWGPSRRAQRLGAGTAFVDEAALQELNEVSNRTLAAMLAGSEREAGVLAEELQEMRTYLEQEGELASSRFLKVMQGLLRHEVLPEAEQLEHLYARAFNRICNQVAGSNWRLAEEGKPAQVGADEPQFSTWEDVMNKKRKQASLPEAGGSRGDMTYYRLLDVNAAASSAEIKAAYRQKALTTHPDVSDAEDASERFAALSAAYDVLSNDTSRALYDKYGAAGMARHLGAASGSGNASRAWDEFKPYVRDNKRTQSRAASSAAATSSSSDKPADQAVDRTPEVGDVVEYPLRDIEIAELCDGRTKGVGLLVGRNIDRGDAAKLPPEQLDLCEIEPLRQREPHSPSWIPDELGVSSFARLPELRPIPVVSFDKRFDVWRIDAELSPGCGGPELPEEVML